MSAISALLASPPNNYSTTLSAGISSSDLTIPLNSVAGLGTEGIGVLYSKDTAGLPVTTSIEFVHWTNISGNNLTLTDTDDRGISGSASGAQAHSSGDTFEVWTYSSYYPRSALLAVLTSAGILDTTKVVDLTTAQTLLNKIITSPSIGGTVSGSAIYTTPTLTSPTFQGTVEGWVSSNESWSYASATSITVPSNATLKYQIGDKIRLKQGAGYKYFYVVAVGATALTVLGGSDYTVANAAITDNDYSRAEDPFGWPAAFSVSAITFDTATIDNGSGANPALAKAYYKIKGRKLEFWIALASTNVFKAGTGTYASFTIPTTMPAPSSTYNDNYQSIGDCFTAGAASTIGGVGFRGGLTSVYATFSSIADNTQLTSFSFHGSYLF